MYTIYVVFKCFSGKREAFVEKVKEEGILEAIRNENGCIRYEYYFSENDPNELLLLEAWESKAHQEIHIHQAHMDKLRALKNGYIETTSLGEFELK